MANSTLVVTDVTTRDDRVTVSFEDGHRVVFNGYTHGWGYQIEALRQFFIYQRDEPVVQYNSRLHRVGPNEDEHCFTKVADGYSMERIIAYWEAARDHIQLGFDAGNDDLWVAWRICLEGWSDLEAIKEGRKPLP